MRLELLRIVIAWQVSGRETGAEGRDSCLSGGLSA